MDLPNPAQKQLLRRISLPLLAVSVSYAAARLVMPWVGHNVFILFLCGVLITALLGGFGEGVLAIVLSLLAMKFSIFATPLVALSRKTGALVRFTNFALFGLFTNAVGNGLRSELAQRKTEVAAQKFLAELSSALAESLNTEAILATVMRTTLRDGCAGCQIVLRETDGGDLYASMGLRSEDAAAHELVESFEADPGRWPLLTSVLRTRRPALAASGSHFAIPMTDGARERQLLEALRLDYCLTVPLTARGRALGAMAFLGDGHPDNSCARTVAVACSVANRVALALDNAILYRQAREMEARFAAIFNQAAVGMVQADVNGRWMHVNEKLCEILDTPREELIGRQFQELTHPDDIGPDNELAERLLSGSMLSVSREKRYRRRDGSYVWTSLTLYLVRAESGRPKYRIAVIQDISQRHQAEARLVYMANHDAVTGLPNRHLFNTRLQEMLADAEGTGGALLLLDLDNFKGVNDSLGHDMGDRLIVEAAERLRGCVRPGDTVARLGGDEFAALLPGAGGSGGAEPVGSRILNAMAEPYVIDGHELFVTASVGIALLPAHGRDAAMALKNADTALYDAKGVGGNALRFYTQEMGSHAVRRLKLKMALRRAMEREELHIEYQPILHAAGGKIVAVEALARWTSRELGPVPPAEFIPIAEETGLIHPIGAWVLTEACRQTRALHDAGHTDLRVAVNLSGRQFQQRELEQVVANALDDSGLPAEFLELELTESVLMRRPERAASIVRQLRAWGVGVSVDDFGTGYSSLSYLKRFRIDNIKIDRSFVRDVHTNPEDQSIVQAIVALARSLQLGVVAEGVETVEQLAFLRRLGCQHMQGYLFSRPLTPAQLTPFLARPVAAIIPHPHTGEPPSTAG